LGRFGLRFPPALLALPDQIGETAERDLDPVRQCSEQERGSRYLDLELVERDIRVGSAGGVETTDQ